MWSMILSSTWLLILKSSESELKNKQQKKTGYQLQKPANPSKAKTNLFVQFRTSPCSINRKCIGMQETKKKSGMLSKSKLKISSPFTLPSTSSENMLNTSFSNMPEMVMTELSSEPCWLGSINTIEAENLSRNMTKKCLWTLSIKLSQKSTNNFRASLLDLFSSGSKFFLIKWMKLFSRKFVI